jgi:hypothetical protein
MKSCCCLDVREDSVRGDAMLIALFLYPNWLRFASMNPVYGRRESVSENVPGSRKNVLQGSSRTTSRKSKAQRSGARRLGSRQRTRYFRGILRRPPRLVIRSFLGLWRGESRIEAHVFHCRLACPQAQVEAAPHVAAPQNSTVISARLLVAGLGG